MTKKGVIIGTFVKKKQILCFIENLNSNFGINYDKIFVYSIESNKNEYLVTFKSFDKDKYVSYLTGSTIMHVKNGCLFSINALNRLISEKYNEKSERPFNEIEIDWNEYKDKLIILTNGELNIKELTKIEDKCCLFSLK